MRVYSIQSVATHFLGLGAWAGCSRIMMGIFYYRLAGRTRFSRSQGGSTRTHLRFRLQFGDLERGTIP
jgi:hypothetical protein